MFFNLVNSRPIKCVALSLLALLTAFLFFTPILSSDDIGMNMIVSGSYTLHPDEHALFTNIIYSSLLKWLYTFDVSIPWYSILLYSVLFISFASYFYFISYNQNRNFSISYIFILYSVLLLYILIYLQFTIVSSAAGIAGLFIFFQQSSEFEKGKYRVLFLTSLFLIFLSIIIRFESFLLIFFLASPLFLFQFYDLYKSGNYNSIKRLTSFFISILL